MLAKGTFVHASLATLAPGLMYLRSLSNPLETDSLKNKEGIRQIHRAESLARDPFLLRGNELQTLNEVMLLVRK